MLTRRAIAVLAAFLIGGAIVNVGVAWGCALWRPLPLASTTAPGRCFIYEDGRVAWFVWSNHMQGAWHVRSTTDMRHAAPADASYLFEKDDPSWKLPPWTQPRQGDPGRLVEVQDGAWGWPWVSVRMHYSKAIDSIQPVVWKHQMKLKLAWEREFILPLKPIPSAFAMNTLAYALVIWLALAARRSNRIRRGLCPACAYPVRGESPNCTECGKPVKPLSMKPKA